MNLFHNMGHSSSFAQAQRAYDRQEAPEYYEEEDNRERIFASYPAANPLCDLVSVSRLQRKLIQILGTEFVDDEQDDSDSNRPRTARELAGLSEFEMNYVQPRVN